MAGFLAARSHYWRGRFFASGKRHRRAIREFELKARSAAGCASV